MAYKKKVQHPLIDSVETNTMKSFYFIRNNNKNTTTCYVTHVFGYHVFSPYPCCACLIMPICT